MNEPGIRVLIVDDHAVVRSGYRTYLEQMGGFEVVAEADNAAEAYAQYKRCQPDIVIMDIMMPGASGIDASRRILAFDRDARILVFSMYVEPIVVRQALGLGVRGMLSKDSAPEQLCEAAIAVARGQRYLGGELAMAMAFSPRSPRAEIVEKLSGREFEIFQMLVSGASIDDIAQALNLSSKTVANRLSQIRQKLDANSDIQLVRMAAAIGIVSWIPAPGSRPGGD
ncbi:DNA-binding response regulator [Rubrivivax gelatinosus]|nr:DNA-binding response regulator [Rubrivivax gelatinosus]